MKKNFGVLVIIFIGLFFINTINISAASLPVTKIYGDANGFWEGGAIVSEKSNNLLGFEIGGKIYSTGVDDEMLKNQSINFIPSDYRAFSVASNNISLYSSTAG